MSQIKRNTFSVHFTFDSKKSFHHTNGLFYFNTHILQEKWLPIYCIVYFIPHFFWPEYSLVKKQKTNSWRCLNPFKRLISCNKYFFIHMNLEIKPLITCLRNKVICQPCQTILVLHSMCIQSQQWESDLSLRASMLTPHHQNWCMHSS